MFDKILKQEAAAPQPGATPSAGISEGELQAWHEKIVAASGDDGALLQLAQQAPGADLKLAALAALTQEDALRQAMREFRDQDKRLYRAAKARWETVVARREAFEQAPVLIATARSLLEQPSIPANRLVELDHAWGALKTGMLDAALVRDFGALRAKLGTRVRSHGESEQALARWLAAVDTAIRAVTAGLADLARGAAAPARFGATRELAASLLQLVNEAPAPADEARIAEKIDAANRALALAASVVQRAEFLRSLPVAGLPETEEKARVEQWRGIPEVSDELLQNVLAHRFSDWRNASEQERQRDREARRRHEGELNAQERKRRMLEMQRHVELAEAAHAAGQVAELTRLMTVIDNGLKPGPVNAELARRIESLRQEQQRLIDWQRWSGGQRREELVAEAQALAKLANEKLALKAHAEAIDKLRERWKELDKLGAATGKTLWLAFDGALKAAYVPVAANLEKLKAARNENLAARNRVVEGLVAAQAKLASTEGTPPDWRAIGRTLEEARTAWRKLGPVEHTVPRDAQRGEHAVTARYTAALQALEGPLTKAYGEAGRQRAGSGDAAESLGEATPLARDAIDKVRALQTQWQAHAKALPLPRREENALWTAFKAATDAVFTARDAARAAREAEANAPITAREAIIDTFSTLPADASASDIKRTLATADTAWRASPRIHGPQAARIESRYREARDVASKRLRAIAERAALARYDALLAAMRICDEREASSDSPDLEARWSALTDLPPTWKSAMDARFNGTTPAKRPPLPDTLLNLEAALSIDSPAEYSAARRALKMQALKVAMENRRPDAGASPADIERWLLDASSTPRPDDTSRSRPE